MKLKFVGDNTKYCSSPLVPNADWEGDEPSDIEALLATGMWVADEAPAKQEKKAKKVVEEATVEEPKVNEAPVVEADNKE